MNMKHILACLTILAAANLSAETISSSSFSGTKTADGGILEYTADSLELCSGTDLAAINGGTIKFSGKTVHGGSDNGSTDARILVESNSFLIGDYLKLYKGNNFTNKGTTTVDYLCLQGGTFTNYGDLKILPIEEQPEESSDEYALLSISSEEALVNNFGNIEGPVDIFGGTLNAMEGSSYGEVNLYGGGTLNVKGSITLNDCIYSAGEPASICFDMTGSIDMGNNSIWLDEAITFVLNVNSEVSDDTVIFKDNFFTNYSNDIEGFGDTVVHIKGANGTTTTRTMSQLSVPEPTTTLMCLLAFIGGVARRRRASR